MFDKKKIFLSIYYPLTYIILDFVLRKEANVYFFFCKYIWVKTVTQKFHL